MAYEVGVVAELDLTKYDKNVRDFERQADRVEDALDSIAATFNEVERAARLDATVTIDADTSELLRAQSDIRELDGQNADIDLDVDRSELESTENDIRDIRNMEAIELAINIAGNWEAAATAITNLANEAFIASEAGLAAFEQQTGRTNTEIEELVESTRLGAAAFGASREEIVALARQAYAAGVPFDQLDEAITSAYTSAAADPTGQTEVTEALGAQVALVRQGVVDSYGEAADVITTGFLNGANAGGDFLETLTQFSGLLGQYGFDGEQALGLIVDGINNGTFSAERAVNALIELNSAFMETGEDGAPFTEDVQAALEMTGALDEALAFRQDPTQGAALFAAITEGLNNAELDAAERATAISALFGSSFEEIGEDAAMALDLDAGLDIEGRAQTVADTVETTMQGAIQRIYASIDEAALDILQSLPIDEWITESERKIGVFLDEIRAGRSFEEALQLSLEIPGLADALTDVENLFNRIGIGLLTVLQRVLETLGENDLAAQLGEEITRLGTGQLGLDLDAAQAAEDVQTAINDAMALGVDFTDLQTGLTDAYTRALADGNIEAARAIAEAGAENTFISDTGVRTNLTFDPAALDAAAAQAQDAFESAILAGDFAGAQLIADNLGTDLQAELERAISEGNFDVAALIAQRLDEQEGTSRLLSVIGEAAAAGLSEEQINTILENAQAASDGTMTMAEEVALSADEVTTTLQDAEVSFDEFSATVQDRSQLADSAFSQFADNVGYKAAEAAGALQHLQDEYAELVESFGGQIPGEGEGGTPEDPGTGRGFAAGGVGHGTFMVHEDELVSTNTPLAILNEQTTDSILSGLATLFAGGFSGGGASNVTNYNTVNVVMNNNGSAAATAGGNRISDIVRGYG